MQSASDTTGTVARVMMILRALAESAHPLGIKELASITGLPSSTTHRLLDLLTEGNFVQKVEATRKYGVGSDVVRIAHLVAARVPLTGFIQPILDELCRETGETALFAAYVPSQKSAVYIAKSDTSDPLRFRIALHQRIDPARAAAGLAILAFLPDADRDDLLASAVANGASASRDRRKLGARLASVRDDRYVVSEGEELPGLVGIAVPATAPSGTLQGALAIVIPEVRFLRKRMGQYRGALLEAANRFSRLAVNPYDHP